jgi:hypothetical protein
MKVNEIIGPSLNEAEACQPCHCEEHQRRGNLVFSPRIAAQPATTLHSFEGEKIPALK